MAVQSDYHAMISGHHPQMYLQKKYKMLNTKQNKLALLIRQSTRLIQVKL